MTIDGVMEHLVRLTSLHDREQVDLALARALGAICQARAAGVHRVQPDRQGVMRWMSCGVSRPGELLSSDPPWVDLSELPGLDDFPLRQDVITDLTVVQVPTHPPLTPGWLTVMPFKGHADETRHLTSDSSLMRHPGVIELETAHPLSVGDIMTLQTVLQVVENHLRLLDSSQRDALTGLLNRQTFDTTFLAASLPNTAGAISDEAERRRGMGDLWWLGVIDIDHFKQVNDRFGHLIGDEVLVLLARLMHQTFRHHDRLFRFGGEEFVVMLRCADEASAMVAFERLRARVAEYPFPQVKRVTVSAGVTQVQRSDSPSAAFSRADDAVYQAKHQGRDRVLSHAALLAAGVVTVAKHEGDVELF
ncbi:MAG: GGDEF domain-containing protein [Rubrivivax sp.]|nr:MAG: GGDEF domain-containing protein [Rubrivivax sp.]